MSIATTNPMPCGGVTDPTAQPTGDQGAGVRGGAEMWEGRLTRPSGSRLRHRQPTGRSSSVRCHHDITRFRRFAAWAAMQLEVGAAD